MGRRAMAVLAAVAVGLIGVVSVLFYANGADARAVADQRPRTAYIASQLVPSGTSAADAVARGLMAPTQIAARGVPAGALTRVDAANGKLLALTDIAAGEIVVASRFGTAPLGQKAIQVPDGNVAVSVSLADPARVGAFVTPGSHIVIYDTFATPAGVKETRVLLDDVLVIAVGSNSLTPVSAGGAPAPAQASGSSVLVTVALLPDRAPKLVHGIQTGTLYAALRGTNTQAKLGQIVTDTSLFN